MAKPYHISDFQSSRNSDKQKHLPIRAGAFLLPGKGKSYMKFEYSPVVRLRDEDGSYKICEPLCTGFQWVGGGIGAGRR